MADVLDVAAAVVEEVAGLNIDEDLISLKLQKLVYYSQAWYLAETGGALFDDPIEAWSRGPVVRRLWDLNAGARSVAGAVIGNARKLTKAERSLIQRVVRRYGPLSATRLVELTHREAPWKVTRKGLPDWVRSERVISSDLMRSAYIRSAVSPEEVVTLVMASSRLEGLETDPALVPVLRAVANRELDAEKAVGDRIAAIRR